MMHIVRITCLFAIKSLNEIICFDSAKHLTTIYYLIIDITRLIKGEIESLNFFEKKYFFSNLLWGEKILFLQISQFLLMY